MTADGDGWYSYIIYGFDSVKVLFNNGGNIQIPAQNEPGFDVSGEMWYRNGEWTTERPEEILVYFYAPSGWSSPNIYYYKDDSDTGTAWPGESMNDASDGWYSFTITKYSSAKVLFNSGSNQIPAQNQPGLDATGIMWYKDGVWCDLESDSDSDGLPDYMEMLLGTDLTKADSDGDGLPDGFEALTLGTDPLKADSDGNGVNDSLEDLDGDGLTNLQEYNLGTNPNNADSDGDGLTDGEEVTIVRCLDGKVYVKFNSNPCDIDSDDDFLLDNSPRYDSNGRIIIPADPEPSIYNGPLGLWEQEYTQYIEDKVPHHYNGMTDVEDIYYKYLEEIKNLKLETSEDIFNYFILKTRQEVNDPIHSSYSTMIGAFLLMFPKDELGMALHALPIAWQSKFGYNKLYDFLFYVGTLGQCSNTSFYFDYNDKEYVLWGWRGDYLNLGAGAELGIYVESGIPGLWDASDFVVPMSQSLYTLKDGTLDNVFSWDPAAAQWWICGFNPDYMSPKASALVSLERIDFSDYTEAYWSLKNNVKNQSNYDMIFDDNAYTVWFSWRDSEE